MLEEPVFSYCNFVLQPISNPVHRLYHDTEYGLFSRDERVLFERLILEINQAGLSWETILKKRETFTEAYSNWDVDQIANYGDADFERLMNNPGVIRNRLKILAAINNAQVVVGMRESHGGFSNWLESQGELTKPEWVKVFKKTFRFTGGEIVNEFLMSLGYLPGAHDDTCPIGREFATQFRNRNHVHNH